MGIRRTFLDVLALREPLLDVLFAAEVSFGGEGFLEARAEVVVSQGVLAAEVEKFWCGVR